MFSTYNLLFLIFFLVPGTCFLLFNRYLRPVPRIEQNETVKLSSALLFSFVVFAVISAVLSKQYVALLEQQTFFDNSSLLLGIILVHIVISFGISILWINVKQFIIVPLINITNKALKRPIESNNESIWVDIFEDNSLGNVLDSCVVKIEKYGVSSIGIIRSYSPPHSSRIEFLLESITPIQAYFEFDAKQTDKNKKYFSNILYEYLDLTNGIKITFYDSTKFKKHIEQHHFNAKDTPTF